MKESLDHKLVFSRRTQEKWKPGLRHIDIHTRAHQPEEKRGEIKGKSKRESSITRKRASIKKREKWKESERPAKTRETVQARAFISISTRKISALASGILCIYIAVCISSIACARQSKVALSLSRERGMREADLVGFAIALRMYTLCFFQGISDRESCDYIHTL